jgi:hypothetical protein
LSPTGGTAIARGFVRPNFAAISGQPFDKSGIRLNM